MVRIIFGLVSLALSFYSAFALPIMHKGEEMLFSKDPTDAQIVNFTFWWLEATAVFGIVGSIWLIVLGGIKVWRNRNKVP